MDKKAMMKGFLFLEEFRKFDPEMQMQTAATLLIVAMRPGITTKELTGKLGISQASCSRNVAALSKLTRHGEPGPDLIVAEEDPHERRRKVMRLTPKGQRVAESLARLLNGEEAGTEAPAVAESE